MADNNENILEQRMSSDHDLHETLMSKTRIIKNIVVVCVGVFLLFTAYDGPTMLQSTMNKKGGIGVASQAIIYASFCTSSLLLPKYIIKKLGNKMTIVISMLTYAPYIAYNLYPHWIVMVPTSILVGSAAPLLWGSQASYLNDISSMFSELLLQNKFGKKQLFDQKIKPKQTINSETNISNSESTGEDGLYSKKIKDVKTTPKEYIPNGNVDAELHLPLEFRKCMENNSFLNDSNAVVMKVEKSGIKDADNRQHVNFKTMSQFDLVKRRKIETVTARVFGLHGMAHMSCHLWSNAMSYFILKSGVDPFYSSNITNCECGAYICDTGTKCVSEELEEVSDRTRYTLTGICILLAIISIVIIALFLDPLDSKPEKISFNFQSLAATFQLAKKTDPLLLIPLSFYIGQVQGFYVSDFTKAYISCAWGTYHVSLVSACYGFFCALSSSVSGWLVKILGRIVVMTFFALLNAASCILFLLWNPDPNSPEMFFVAAGMWGAYVGTIWAQLRVFYGVLFKEEEEAAFAAFHVWYSLGFGLSFAYSSFFCTSLKIYLLLIVSSLGYFGYLLVEKNHSLKISETT